MDDNQRRKERRLTRCYECNRLEDEFWNMAYEQIWPLVRRSLARRQSAPSSASRRNSATVVQGGSRHGGQAQRRSVRARKFAAAG